MLRKLMVMGAVAGGIGAAPVALILLHFNGEPVEKDVFYHLAVARDYVETPLRFRTRLGEGILAEHPADRELVFHLILAALLCCGLAPMTAAVVVSATGSAMVALIVHSHTRSLICAACAVFGSSTVLYRSLMGRPHGLAVALSMLGIVLLLRRRYWWAGIVNGIYIWSYSVPVVIAFAAIVWSIVKRDWRPCAVVLGTSIVGIIAHPHFPGNAVVLWYQGPEVVMNGLLGNFRNIELPDELKSGVRADLILGSLVPILLLVTGLARRTTECVLVVLQLSFLGLTIGMLRFIEYLVPLISLSARPTVDFVLPKRPWYARCIVGSLFVAAALVLTHKAYVAAQETARPEYRGAALWLQQNKVTGYVFNAQWDSYAELRFFGGDIVLAQGQDPLFVAAVDPDRYRQMRSAESGGMSLEEFRKAFPTRYIVARRGSPILKYRRRPEVTVRYSDSKVAVLEIVGTR